MKRDWGEILDRAAAIVRSYDTPVTLRQLFYRLVSAELIRNTRSEYTQLSSRTAAARRDGWFPSLVDQGRGIERPLTFSGVDNAREWLASRYRRDRTEGQEFNVYLAVEKATLTSQLDSWFGRLGMPIVALRGYSSETLEREVMDDVINDGRDAVLLYAGDFDPSGEDILRNFVDQTKRSISRDFGILGTDGRIESGRTTITSRVARFDEIVRVALTPEQVEEHDLPPQPGKADDTRSKGFKERHGRLIQVEVEALDPETLRRLYQDAIDEYFDLSIWEEVVDREREERESLAT